MLARLADRYLPLWRHRNVALFYVLQGTYNAWFVAGVWVFVWGKFMTNGEIGLSDALTFAVGFLLEIPSGALADFMGRRRAIIIGNVLLFVGNLALALSGSFWGITLWYLVWMIGYTFQSGATEAFAYDYVKSIGKEDEWHRVVTTSGVILRVVSITAIALGGWLFAIWFRLPYFAFAGASLIGLIAALLLQETKVFEKQSLTSARMYGAQIRDGLSVLGRKTIFPVALSAILVSSLYYMYNWGLLRPLTMQRFGYNEVTMSLLQATVSLAVIGGTIALARYRKQYTLEKMIFGLSLLYTFLFASFYLPYQWLLGGVVLVTAAIAASAVDQLFLVYINKHTRSEHRATTLSAVSVFTRAPYVVIAILMGALADRHLLPEFSGIVGLIGLVGVMVGVYLYWNTQRKRLGKAL